MERINVIGTSCSGKSTLARAIARRRSLPYVELDALFWGPDWTPVPDRTFRRLVEEAAAGGRWVIDGSYSTIRPVTWSRADTVIWLDYPMPIVLGRWLRRTVTRIRTREEFWPGTGNRESVRNALRPDGLLPWILRTHRSRRRRTVEALRQRPDLELVRLRSPVDAERWLSSLAPAETLRRRSASTRCRR